MAIEVDAPCRHQIAGMVQVVEQMLVQALIPHPTVEAFHEPVLHRFSRRDGVPIDPADFLPFQNRF